MNKMIFQLLCLLTLAVTSIILFSTGKSQAQTRSFTSVSTFGTAGGRVGFFEQATGRIFIYDENLSQCVFVGQMTALGEAIQRLK